MHRLLSRRWWPGLLGLAWLAAAGVGQAWERPRLNTEFNFRFEVTMGPEQVRPTAPWYTYFPADPRLMQSPQMSPYPSWPRTFPPAAPPVDMRRQSSVANPTGPMLTQYQTVPYSYVQPVSYYSGQVPSYWYQGR